MKDAKKIKPVKVTRPDGRIEYVCEHGVGHGNIHGCDGCCSKNPIKRLLMMEDLLPEPDPELVSYVNKGGFSLITTVGLIITIILLFLIYIIHRIQ